MVLGRFCLPIVTDKIYYQRVLRAKDSVRVEIGVSFDEQVRREWRKTVC